MKKSNLIFLLIGVLTIPILSVSGASALEAEDESIFSQNNITFYDPSECDDVGGNSGSLSICDTNLPEETIKMLEAANIKSLAEANMERYKYAEEKTGLPWQVLAALHFREGSMDSGKSISNGQPLGNYVNIDGIQVYSDPNQDAEAAAQHFIDNVKSHYNIDVIADPSSENYAWGFLAYNRGAMYKCNGNVSYDKSPYVMNFYDDSHMSMSWIDADSLDCKGNRLNGVAGKVNKQLGALAVMAYLCGGESSVASASGSSSGGSSSSSGGSSSGGPSSGGENTCAKLGELRTEMWNKASQTEKENFMYVVSGEDHSIAGVEGYMNQIISKHGNDGTLGNWLGKQCVAFRGGMSCSGSHSITSEEQEWIDQALAGSNNIKFAIGNATGGSGVGAGKIVCVWDGNQCREDVNYDAAGGTGKCNTYSPSASFGECWGLEGEDEWAEEMSQNCGSGCTTYEGDYPQYLQSGQEWSSLDYGGCSVGKCGCGPTSMAMLVTAATGQDVFPQDIVELTKDCPYWSACAGGEGRVNNGKKICEKYGCEAKGINYTTKEEATQKMKEALNEGWMLHFSGGGSYPYSGVGHFIGIFNIKSGDKVMTANSAFGGNKELDLSTVVNGLHFAITAIRGNGSGGPCSDNPCPTDSGSAAVGEAASIPLEERMNYLFPDGVPTSPNEMEKYLETIDIPIKDESGNQTTMKLTVHKKLATEIKAVFQDLLSISNFRIKAHETGAYSWRMMASGTGSQSHHSYGVAIDVNATDNPAAYSSGSYNPGGNYFSVTSEVVDVWKKHGFYWGGDWSGGFRDYMHFTYTDH